MAGVMAYTKRVLNSIGEAAKALWTSPTIIMIMNMGTKAHILRLATNQHFRVLGSIENNAMMIWIKFVD